MNYEYFNEPSQRCVRKDYEQGKSINEREITDINWQKYKQSEAMKWQKGDYKEIKTQVK
jgi:hypothetical protein